MDEHEVLANAPLVYTIGVIRFPRLHGEGLSRVLEGFHQAARHLGYKLRDDLQARMVNAQLGPEGLRLDNEVRRINQFANPERTWAFVLTEEVLCLHTVNYHNGQDFVRRFREGLEAIQPVLCPEVDLVEAVGGRYVNLVVPNEGESLSDYLESWVLPLEPPKTRSGLPIEVSESMYFVAAKSGVGELRLQALRNPPTTLPPDLDTPLIQKNNWKRPLPAGREFALLDVDHSCRHAVPQPFSVSEVAGQIGELCSTVGEWFLSAGTDHARDIWRKQS